LNFIYPIVTVNVCSFYRSKKTLVATSRNEVANRQPKHSLTCCWWHFQNSPSWWLLRWFKTFRYWKQTLQQLFRRSPDTPNFMTSPSWQPTQTSLEQTMTDEVKASASEAARFPHHHCGGMYRHA